MAIECRILRNKYGEIDHVITNNGERSELFDNLVEIAGGNKDAALDLYALTETEEFKELTELRSTEERTKFLKDFQKKQITNIPLFSKNQGQEAPREVLNQVTDRLKESGLANNVYQMTNDEIEAKLVELGVEPIVAKQVVAYHGSPHSFDRFTTDAMGTGEGAQAFGWGLYFTDLESIARNYAKTLANKKMQIVTDGKVINVEKDDLTKAEETAYVTLELDYSIDKAIQRLEYNQTKRPSNNNLEAINILKRTQVIGNRNLYKVSLHKGKTPITSDNFSVLGNLIIPKKAPNMSQEEYAGKARRGEIKPLKEFNTKSEAEQWLREEDKKAEYTWLEWDKSFDIIKSKILEQADKEGVRDILEGELKYITKGEELYTAVKLVKGNQKEASLFLLRAGIDGIKYPAESTVRGTTSDTARGFNYVVFDENVVTIEEQLQFSKKGIEVNTAGFTYKGDVYLNTDVMGLDTPIHEFGHLHLDWLKENRTDLYKAGLSLIKKNKEEAQQYINIVKQTQPDLKEGTEKFNNEVLAQVIGDQGAKLINSKKEGSIADWLKSVWESIKDVLGLSNYTAEQVANMTLEEFGTASATDMLKGEILNKYQYENTRRDRTRWDESRGPQTLEGAPTIEGATGADPELTYLAEEYAKSIGLDYKRQPEYVEVDEDRAKRIAEAYDKMEHNPQNPVVKEAFQNLINQTIDQYRVLEAAGYKFWLFDETNDPYNGNPYNAMRDLRKNKQMAVFATEAGFGSGATELNVEDNPMLQDTGIRWGFGSLNGEKKRVLANDLFRAVHDAFGHGLEGSGFRARGEENAWQSHARLFTGSALGAITSETRGQNSWLNYGKFGEKNRTAKVEDTVFADQKTGLMPDWTWKEGINLPKQLSQRSNQIKSAIENVGTFSTSSNDIRYKKNKYSESIGLGNSEVSFNERRNPITGESTGEIELQLIETEDLYRGKGQGRAALKKFLEYTDAASKNVYLAINPRDAKTKFTKLVDFYKSEGFKMESTGFEMTRKAKPLMPTNFDINGEADLKTVLDFSNRSSDGLTSEEKVEAINFMLSAGLKSSTELLSKLEDTFFKSGLFIPNKVRMSKSGLYNKFEISEIIQSPILQKEIKELVLALRNTEEISVEYDGKFISGENTSLNNFGKQTVTNPYILEKEIATEIAGLPLENVKESLSSDISAKYKNDADFKKTVDRIATDHKLVNIKRIDNGELVDKTSNTSDKLKLTLVKEIGQELFTKLDYLLNSISENVWNQNLDLVSKSIEDISELAKQNGVDFSNLSTKVYSVPRQEVVTLLGAFVKTIVSEDTANLMEFADLYDSMFDITQPQKELIKTDSEFDIVLDSELSEQELFSSYSLVKKAESVYRKIEPTTLEDLYDSFFNYKNLFPNSVKDIEQLKSYVQEKSVADVENGFSLEEGDMEKMWMYKKFFNFPINISKERVEVERTKNITMDSEYLMGDFVKDFNVYLLESGNKYFKVTERGIELENNDPISKQEAKLSLSEDLVEALSQYDAISRHLNLGLESQSDNYEEFKSENEERVNAVNNPDSVPKLSGEYIYIEEGILAAKNEANTFVRTPVGVFELVYEMNNIKFFNKLPSADANYKIFDLEKPLTNVDFNNHFYLQNSVDVFKEAKNSYSKKELEKINRDYFEC